MTLVQTFFAIAYTFLACGMGFLVAGQVFHRRKSYLVAIAFARVGTMTFICATAFFIAAAIAQAK